MTIKLYNKLIDIQIKDQAYITSELENKHAIGHWNPKTNTIVLSNTTTKEVQRLTLIHELVHAIDYLFGYDKFNDMENICDFIAGHHDEIHRIVKEWEANK